MKYIMNKIGKSSYLKNLITLSAGTIIAQMVLVLISPILTRIYTPEQLGIFSVFLTIISIFTPVVNARYDMAIVTAENDRESNALAISALSIGVAMSILVGLGLWIYNFVVPGTFEGVGIWIYLTIPILIINSVTNVLTSYNNRFQQYKLMASVGVIRSGAQAITQVLFGLLSFGIVGLVISQLISVSASIKMQAKYAIQNASSFKELKTRDIMIVIRKYKNQPIYSAPAILLNALSYSILIFFITELYGAKEVGFYSISFKVLGLPITLISTNVARIFFERASKERQATGSFHKTYKKTAIFLTLISMPFFILLMIVSQPLFEFVYGYGWGRAGLFVAILSPMFSVRFVVSSLSLSLVIANKQKIELLLQAGFLFQSLAVFIVSRALELNIEYFLGLISVCFTINYIVFFIVMYKISSKETVRQDSED